MIVETLNLITAESLFMAMLSFITIPWDGEDHTAYYVITTCGISMAAIAQLMVMMI